MQNESETTERETKPTEPAAPVKRPRRPRVATKAPAEKAARSAKPARAPKTPGPKFVVLFRHGIAEAAAPDKPDAERSLTTNGHDRTKRAARGLAKLLPQVDAICSSPFLRALQTALWVTKAYGGAIRVRTTEALLPEANPESVRQLIRETEGSTIVLVGHEPHLTRCLAGLLGLPSVRADLRRAGCIGVRIDQDGHGALEWMFPPRALRSL